MKYNKDLFELGKYYSSIEREEKIDYVIENTKKRLLTIFENRIRFIRTSCEEVNDLIKLEFKSNLFGKDDEGYNEIKIGENIKWKMEKIGQKDEFLKIFNEFEYKKPNYSNWYIEDVIMLLTRLVVEHTKILQAIIADYLESLDRQVIENGKI